MDSSLLDKWKNTIFINSSVAILKTFCIYIETSPNTSIKSLFYGEKTFISKAYSSDLGFVIEKHKKCLKKGLLG
jgi:hypothetical protein